MGETSTLGGFEWGSFQADLILCGYPCKSISSQNATPKSFMDPESLTGMGFHALMKFIDVSQPKIVITENVRGLAQVRKQFSNECPLEIQNRAFSSRGYLCYHEIANSATFGLAQSRTRVWVIYLKQNRPRFWKRVLESVFYINRPSVR